MNEHEIPLITTLVSAFGLAFIFGAIANRLRISPIVGYLFAGVLIGPVTPGYVADQELAPELAEIGVILLMFGVGLHFSLKDLLSVKGIAIPGAVGQIALATVMGYLLGWALGWPPGESFVFGLALSVASTVVLLRALQERHLVDSEQGRIAVGWLIVEDLAMVLALVLLPAFAGIFGGGAGGGHGASSAGPGLVEIAETLAITIGKIIAFVALMLVVGRRVIPWVLHVIAHSGSRELFRLGVLAIALGIAYVAAELFGVSFALGAFFAGMILNESPLSQRAAQESLPFRDAFAVLFFVSVGMLFDPRVLLEHPFAVTATALIIIVGKSIAAFAIVRAFGHSNRVAMTISASLAQVGEFSFILAALGIDFGLLSEFGRDLILAGAIISIILNPVLFDLLTRRRAPPAETPESAEAGAQEEEAEGLVPTKLSDHAVLVGYGRVGSLVGEDLEARGTPFIVIEDDLDIVQTLRARNIEAYLGNGVSEDILKAANVAGARWIFVAIPEAFEAGQITRYCRSANPSALIIARAHSDGEVEHLKAYGASVVIMGEREIAKGMVETAFADAPPLV